MPKLLAQAGVPRGPEVSVLPSSAGGFSGGAVAPAAETSQRALGQRALGPAVPTPCGPHKPQQSQPRRPWEGQLARARRRHAGCSKRPLSQGPPVASCSQPPAYVASSWPPGDMCWAQLEPASHAAAHPWSTLPTRPERPCPGQVLWPSCLAQVRHWLQSWTPGESPACPSPCCPVPLVCEHSRRPGPCLFTGSGICCGSTLPRAPLPGRAVRGPGCPRWPEQASVLGRQGIRAPLPQGVLAGGEEASKKPHGTPRKPATGQARHLSA